MSMSIKAELLQALLHIIMPLEKKRNILKNRRGDAKV